MVFFGILGVLAAPLVCMAVIDLRAKRRGTRYSGVDTTNARADRRRSETELRTRTIGIERIQGPGSQC
ncbi:MAG TPA: hypothetical protein VGP36_07685 [Mycobacteriales bacterium]|jgi:hypothetical protein|nr:hypothetical protein [Mycobacteriales bacterium]